MRKQTTNDFDAGTDISSYSQIKESKKNAPLKKSVRYIYTEADLGEGILDVGIETATNPGRVDSRLVNSWM